MDREMEEDKTLVPPAINEFYAVLERYDIHPDSRSYSSDGKFRLAFNESNDHYAIAADALSAIPGVTIVQDFKLDMRDDGMRRSLKLTYTPTMPE